ncbi:Threonine/homoserine/homoserine lactone efflux protein [Collimonas sp. OK307]|uniref:LysE family translocator n=1 Tax=Collimonas sp. OK307 TaxID=1801620 RepID=UPI0008E312A6|nr:LysE family transporter [Collimonas sp. OK307]SFI03784.1 Threonine/homoserine/homoserine lactone efflux protein [Collimonas sp. OK307]
MTSDFNFPIFALSTAVILLTPGPTNTLLAAAGLERGGRGALPLIACELFGYLIAISVWGAVLAPLQSSYPWVAILARAASSLYLVYIAVTVWRAASMLPTPRQRSIGPKALFMATLLNPKALLFSSAIFPSVASDNMQVYLTATALFSALLIPIGIAWTMFGAALANGRLRFMDRVKLQRATALLLCAFSASVAWATFH